MQSQIRGYYLVRHYHLVPLSSVARHLVGVRMAINALKKRQPASASQESICSTAATRRLAGRATAGAGRQISRATLPGAVGRERPYHTASVPILLFKRSADSGQRVWSAIAAATTHAYGIEKELHHRLQDIRTTRIA